MAAHLTLTKEIHTPTESGGTFKLRLVTTNTPSGGTFPQDVFVFACRQFGAVNAAVDNFERIVQMGDLVAETGIRSAAAIRTSDIFYRANEVTLAFSSSAALIETLSNITEDIASICDDWLANLTAYETPEDFQVAL